MTAAALTATLDGKVAVVTGAGGTMGRAVVRALAADGCRIAAIDVEAEGRSR